MTSLAKVIGSVKRLQLATRCLLTSHRNFHIRQEPPYLDATGEEIPEYNLVNIQIKGFDFTVLEHYGIWIHRTALNMGLDVEDAWATPCEKLHVETFKPKSTQVESDYHLQVYERNIQLADLPSTMAPLLMEVVQAGLPEGVELSVHEHEPEHNEIRYIPDLELRDLYKQLDEIGTAKK